MYYQDIKLSKNCGLPHHLWFVNRIIDFLINSIPVLDTGNGTRHFDLIELEF